MGGWAFRTSYFKLTLASDDLNFPAALADGDVQRLKVDELGHSLRCAAIGYNHNPGDAMISEGLCGRFSRQRLGTPTEAWETALEPA